MSAGFVPFRTASDALNAYLADLGREIPQRYALAIGEPDAATRNALIAEIDEDAAWLIAVECVLLGADGADLVARAEALLREAQ